MKNSVHFEGGTKSDIAFVFSCPGQVERDANPSGPAKGETGKNLGSVMNILTKDYGLKGLTRDEVTITNSWPEVEFNSDGGTDRSEAEIEEVLQAWNLDRLADEIMGVKKYIFASGINAKAVILALKYAHKLHPEVKVLGLRHLGNQSVSQIKEDKDGNVIHSYKNASDKPPGDKRSMKDIKKDNSKRRLERIAYELHQDIIRENFL